jgi:hypothetical protein
MELFEIAGEMRDRIIGLLCAALLGALNCPGFVGG